ncbi:MAG: hypothetical protein KDG89_11825 [Geminicoccaceae bacterium]|nr:hypothetical protein [Geminicoccaceae bacterium]
MSGETPKKTPILEYAVGGAGALLVAFMIGYLLVEAFVNDGGGPADIVLTQGAFHRQASGWRVPVTVENRGDRPAEAVELRAELTLEGGEVEAAALTIDYLPPHGEVEGAFFFQKDPNGGGLKLRAVGYLVP